MPTDLPAITASTEHRTLTLGDLRELVRAADGQPDELIVRGQTIPFHLPDLTSRIGGRMQRLALDTHREGT